MKVYKGDNMTYIPRDATYSTNPIKNYQLWDEQAMLYRPNSVQMADALNSLEATNALQAENALQRRHHGIEVFKELV